MTDNIEPKVDGRTLRKMDISKRFYGLTMPITETGCWIWLGYCDRNGYGDIKVEYKSWRAHRFSWVLHGGDIPEGQYVLHKCDEPSCVNPDHLFVGTQDDNIQDMIKKGRYRSRYDKQI